MSWSALTLSEVRCNLLKQSRLTFSKVSRKSMTESAGLPEGQLESTVSFSRFSPDILRAQNGLMLSLALIFSDVLIGKDLLKQSLLTFFRVNRESRRNRTNEIRRNERSCRGQAWEHRVTFSRCFWPSLISWSALTLSRVRCEHHKQSRLTFFKSQSEIHDGIGRSSRSPTWKHRVLFEVQPWHSQSSKWNNVILSIDILWCPDRQRPSEKSLLTFFRVNRESRRNRTNEIRRNERSCRG